MADEEQLAELVRLRCIEAAEEAFDDAGVRGLCSEGRWQCAMDAIRRLDLQAIVRDREKRSNPDDDPRHQDRSDSANRRSGSRSIS
jgi:hypothetical protein